MSVCSHYTRKTVKVSNICITILIFYISEVSSELCRARTNLTQSNDQLYAAKREIEKVSSVEKEKDILINDLELRLHQTTQERRRYFFIPFHEIVWCKINHVEIVIRLGVMRYFHLRLDTEKQGLLLSLEESEAFLQQEKDKNRQITVALSQARKFIEKRINENEGEINIAKQLQQRAIDSLQVSFKVY